MQNLTGKNLILHYVKSLPDTAGVYRMKDKNGVVLYVGKAKNLKKRVISYTKTDNLSKRIESMVNQTHEMEFVHTGTEIQALLLEADLIKTLKPKYNILFRDDKSFAYLAFSKNHDFPRIFKARTNNITDINAFGPYVYDEDITASIRTIQEAFLIRTCSDYTFNSRKRPCLLYQIKRCSAPCTNLISKELYNKNLSHILKFLTGKSNNVVAELTKSMKEESLLGNYEKALNIRNKINHLKSLQLKQEVRINTKANTDIIALVKVENRVCISVFKFINSVNSGTHCFLTVLADDVLVDEILTQFLTQFYNNSAPNSIVINIKLDNKETLQEALKTKIVDSIKNSNIQKIMDQVILNAEKTLEGLKIKNWEEQFNALKDVLDIPNLIRIEAYDNSHLSGTDPVGAMIVATPEGFLKKAYRHFIIKDPTIKGNDDYAILRHVIERRVKHFAENPQDIPSLIIVDGGKAQLSIVEEILNLNGYSNIPVISIVKGSTRNNRTDKIIKNGAFININNDTLPFFLIERLRNEVHRFAITSQRKKRLINAKKSILDEIAGIGKNRKEALLKKFGSVKNIATASLAELTSVDGINPKIANNILEHFKKYS